MHFKDPAIVRRWRILAFIHHHINEQQIPPTLREIGDATDIPSVSVVNYHLQSLEDLGYIRRKPNSPRYMQLMKEKPLPREVTGLLSVEITAPEPEKRVKRSSAYFEVGAPIATEVIGLPYPIEPRRGKRVSRTPR